MFAPLNRWARWSLAAAVAAVIPTLVGCDSPSNEADRKAKADVEEAQSVLLTEEVLDKPIQLLQTAAGSAEAAPATRMRASSLLGQLLARQARDAGWKVDRLDRDAQRLAMEIGQLSGQVQLANQLAAGYKLLDPTPIVNNLSKQADDARGGADRPIWFEAEGIKFATLNTVSNDLSKIEGEVAQKQQQIQALQVQRDSALGAAESAAKDAEGKAGRESVDAFIQSSNARKQASDLAAQLETFTNELELMNRELAIVDARKGYVTNAAKQLEEGGSSLQAGWATIQKAVAAQRELVKSIATGTGGAVILPQPEGMMIAVETLPAGSIAEKAVKLVEIAKSADDLRADVLEKLNAASKHFADAVTSADAARSAIEKQRAEQASAGDAQKKAWDVARNSLSGATYRVEQADVLRQLAGVHAAHAASLDVRLQLQSLVTSAMQGTGIAPPESLVDTQIQAQYEQAVKEADEAYKSADELLDTVLQSGQATDVEKAAFESAQISRVYGLYRWSQLTADMGAADQSKQHLDLARSIVTDMASTGAMMPKLPPELASAAMVAKPTPEGPAPSGDQTATQPTGDQPPTTDASSVEQPIRDQPADKPAEQPPTEPPPAEQPAGGGPG